MSVAAHRWLPPVSAAARGAPRLLCFPYAGARWTVFKDWQDELPGSAALTPVDYPRRTGDGVTPYDSVPALARHCYEALAPLFEGPVALYGHSLGALVAFEVARTAAADGATLALLVVSGRSAPDSPPARPPVHALDSGTFWREIAGWGGLPTVIQTDPAAFAVFEPGLRADLRLAELYRAEPAAKLPCPVAAIAGMGDVLTPPASMEGWRAQTRDQFTIHLIDGGHFCPFDNRHAFLQRLGRLLEEAGC